MRIVSFTVKMFFSNIEMRFRPYTVTQFRKTKKCMTFPEIG